jgi:hypothetical protein
MLYPSYAYRGTNTIDPIIQQMMKFIKLIFMLASP